MSDEETPDTVPDPEEIYEEEEEEGTIVDED